MKQQTSLIQTIWLGVRCTTYTATACFKLNLVPKKLLTPKQADIRLSKWAKGLIKLVKISFETHNPFDVKLEKQKRYIIMCNHSSLFDIPLSFMAFPNATIRMLAKKELTRIPIFSRTIKKTNTPVINRQHREQAIKDMEATKLLMKEGTILWMAPEGTRSKSGQLQPFKKGGFITAIQAEATIIPLAIKNAHKIYQRDKNRFNLNQNIEMTIGKPIETRGYSIEQRDTLRLKLQKDMEALLAS
jgi:1-acyl-sn-glycerol-3-phosphate acyltransferase